MNEPARWRRVPGQLEHPIAWVFWAILIYTMLAIGFLLGDYFLLAFPIAIAVACAAIWLGHMLLWIGIAPFTARFWPAVTVHAPPASDSADAKYLTEPKIQYPAFAHARGQCGWVQVAMRVSADGQVLRYRIIAQAPARTFAATTARALSSARLPPGEGVREFTSVITFVLETPTAPEWARARLAQLQVA
ncbi:energy transducer TonB [Phenylobacterium sp.]|uniref:energy transducer TonB n=1 Tax=Phenylobacterium sp. TaxID=1871053 RepID=UPI003D2B35DE